MSKKGAARIPSRAQPDWLLAAETGTRALTWTGSGSHADQRLGRAAQEASKPGREAGWFCRPGGLPETAARAKTRPRLQDFCRKRWARAAELASGPRT